MEVATDDMEIVTELRNALAEKVGPRRFELWFGSGAALDLSEKALTLRVPNTFCKQWLQSHFREEIEAACRETLPHCVAVSFRVDRGIKPPAVDKGDRPDNGDQADNGDQPRQFASDGSSTGENGSSQRQDAASKRRPPSARRRGPEFGSFVEGPTNKLARAAAEMVVAQPGEFSPLVIVGPTSVGKTHLLQAIRTACVRSSPRQRAVYLSAEQFTTGFLEALRGGGLPNFRRKYRGVDVLLIDDLQFLRGKRATLVELLYTVDTLLGERRQLVFACDRRPSELSDLGAELTTRLESGMVCRIEPADYETRLGIVARMAHRMGIKVPPDVAEFVASHLTNHAREISGALCRLQATSQALGKPIALTMVQEALREMIDSSTPVVGLADIEKAVCETFGLDPRSLQSARRTKSVAHPRMLAMWLARKYTRSALAEIGEYFGRRSHSTVISARRRVDGWLADGESLEMVDRECNVDEAIRRVEHCLRAG